MVFWEFPLQQTAKKPIKIKNGTTFFLVGMVNNKFANFWIYSLLSLLETKNYVNY